MVALPTRADQGEGADRCALLSCAVLYTGAMQVRYIVVKYIVVQCGTVHICTLCTVHSSAVRYIVLRYGTDLSRTVQYSSAV